jgi:ATP-dependent helicase/nuclease subunit B
MRHALETPERTAALVTPDRTLARRVAAALERWEIRIDDSGGAALGDSAVGSFLRLVAAAAAEALAPVPLLALLKHPLAGGGRPVAEFRALVRALERTALRGPRPGPGVAGLIAALEDGDPRRFDTPEARDRLCDWVNELGRLTEPLRVLGESATVPLADLIRAQIRVAEALAADQAQPGANRLWRHEDGEAAAAFFSDLLRAAEDFPGVALADYPALFDSLLAGRMIRPRFGLHPRLTILGPLEARMVQADLMILGGLNEGTWPAEPAPDPWLSRPMRRQFGLPGPERQIGLSAHDFAQAAAAPQVVLTRSARIEGAPTVPSRWLTRLETVLRALGLAGRIDQEAPHWLAWVRALDQPAAVRPVAAPQPRPPLAARPRELAVTEIETWMRDPYALYARRVLGLEPLEPLAADPGAAERGQFIHQALDAFLRDCPDPLPPDALERLLAQGKAAFGTLLARPEVWAFWWPRFERVARWVVAEEAARRPAWRPAATEIRGGLTLSGPGGPFRLKAKADRLDRAADGSLGILDYKTGIVPKDREVSLGFAPQLPLEAAIAESGGFEGIPAAPVSSLVYWRLSGGEPAGEERRLKGAPAALSADACDGVERLIAAFDDPQTPYAARPRPVWAPRFEPYAHLARLQEWSSEAGGDTE